MENDSDQEMFIKEMKKIDFSVEAKNKEDTLERLLKKFENHEREGRQKIRRPIYALVATLSILLAFSAIVYGQEVVRFMKEILIGDHIQYFAEIDRTDIDYTIPEDFSDEIYDKEGEILEEYPQDFDEYIEIYNESGEQLFLFQDKGDMVLLTREEHMQKTKELRENMTTTFDTLEEAECYFTYDYRKPILPMGYQLSKVDIYNDDDGFPQQNTKYMDMYYSNGHSDIDITLRFMNEETAFQAGGLGELQEVDINGNLGVIIGGKSLDIEIDGILYMLRKSENISIDELLSIAKSLTE